MKKPHPVYLDYNATTPIDPQVLRAMLPYLKDFFGNPSSNHQYGKRSKEAVEIARQQVAKLIGSEASEIVFTSGGTESNNHALIGTAFANIKKGKHIITSQIEHPAIQKPLQYLEEKFNGYDELAYGDHHIFTIDDLNYILKKFNQIQASAKILLTTEKDAVRLQKFSQELKDLPFYVMPIQPVFLFHEENQFTQLITTFIQEFPDKT